MLRIDLNITEACPAGTNLAETTVIREWEEKVSNGTIKTRQEREGTYVRGLPLGDDSAPVPAPIDLKVRDVVWVNADRDDRVALEVVRGGKTVWTNEARKTAEDKRVADKREALELRRKLVR